MWSVSYLALLQCSCHLFSDVFGTTTSPSGSRPFPRRNFFTELLCTLPFFPRLPKTWSTTHETAWEWLWFTISRNLVEATTKVTALRALHICPICTWKILKIAEHSSAHWFWQTVSSTLAKRATTADRIHQCFLDVLNHFESDSVSSVDVWFFMMLPFLNVSASPRDLSQGEILQGIQCTSFRHTWRRVPWKTNLLDLGQHLSSIYEAFVNMPKR